MVGVAQQPPGPQQASGGSRCSVNSCPYCGREFIKTGDLTRHIRTHTGEKPFQCLHCPYRSSRKSTLRNHVDVVDPEDRRCLDSALLGALSSEQATTPTCPFCGRMFRQSGVLTRHIRTHTGEKPYMCPHCPYRASRKAHVEEHCKRKHQMPQAEDPFRYKIGPWDAHSQS
ncbi:zinc finger protein 572-like [Homarus americanus]|uniref:zinc finger protein 572-like n=1 Tax=Homarus americanus TaxID=6706 RepID=UPI001C474E69|nr:zinc finger protein 572-like [Homarus americanus]